MTCEEVRPFLLDMADGSLPGAGEAEAHVATCSSCSAAVADYRDLLARLGALRDAVAEPPEGLLERLVATTGRRRLVRRVASDQRVQHAAFSLGGAVVGAAAIGLWWWKTARRALVPSEPRVSAAQGVGS
jgi:anti-sigma factor RsiW